jgi:hypothetical protein
VPEQFSVIFNDIQNSVKVLCDSTDVELKRSYAELIQKNGSSLRGGLSQFLSTPLKSDKEEIDRLITESLENFLHQSGCPNTISGIIQSTYCAVDSGRIPLHRQVVGVMKRLLKNGKNSLADAGVVAAKNAGNIFFIFFEFDNFALLPNIQSIYQTALSKNQENQFSIMNESLAATIQDAGSIEQNDKNIVIINFSADDGTISRMAANLLAVENQFGINDYRLLHRLFDMGYGSSYQLHLSFDIQKHALGSVITAVVNDDADLEKALLTNGSMIVLEKVA